MSAALTHIRRFNHRAPNAVHLEFTRAQWAGSC